MLNKLLISLVLAFLVVLVIGDIGITGNKGKRVYTEEQPIITPEIEDEWEAQLNQFIEAGGILKRTHKIIPSTNSALLTDTIGTTTYDFGGNSTLGRRIALSQGDTGMGESNGIHFAYYEENGWIEYYPLCYL